MARPQVRHYRIMYFFRQWIGASKLRLSAFVVLGAFVVCHVALCHEGICPVNIWADGESVKINPNYKGKCHVNNWADGKSVKFNPRLMHTKTSSQRTLHFPFRTGCPHDCGPYRKRLCLSDSAASYSRLTVQWYFGQAGKFNPNLPWEDQNGATYYSKGKNFEGPEAFVRTFHAAAKDLKDKGKELLGNPTLKEFKVHKQKDMHAALSYLCCLTPVEAKKGMAVIDKWINETVFDFTLRFTNIQSWHESPNSVTNIVLVDDSSQIQMMKMNHDLNRHLEDAGVPVVIPREDQMPFHSTVAGFRYSKNGETFNHTFEIGSDLPKIFSLVHEVSEKYRQKWDSKEVAFRVQHKPLRSPEPKEHTHPLLDFSGAR